ncbi:MAG: hypothetical protein M3O30_16465 [Planctomycetota bacterium]|nr:hypothetical protein [Planctomycetota bacterium]
MNPYFDELDVWKPDGSEPAAAPPEMPAPNPLPALAPASLPSIAGKKHNWRLYAADSLIWIGVICLLAGGGIWAFRAGMDLRHQLWIDTRSIRFIYDISNGYRYGNQAMREAELDAGLPRGSDAFADQTPAIAAKFHDRIARASRQGQLRRLTLREVLEGITQYYNRLLILNPEGDYSLDYPPLRLTTMTLWVRHVQREHPELGDYPGRSPAPDGYTKPQLEDVTEPLLLFNTACTGIAAITMFFLVWLWTARAGPHVGRDARIEATSRNALPHGLYAFIAATAAFWYAFIILIGPPLRPAPMVQITKAARAGNALTVSGTINAQGNPTRAHIQWGSSVVYANATPEQHFPANLNNAPFSIKLSPVGASESVHLRISATNTGGTTNSDDLEIQPNENANTFDIPPTGGIVWPTWTVWLRMLVLFMAMVALARQLPLPHRGWACGFVAAMLVWFNPLTLLNSIVWPQWDVWILPAIVLAVLLASLDLWLLTGMVIGVACMFKGQMLLGAPIFLLWPLFGGRLGAVFRLLTGSAFGAGFIVWPWIITRPSIVWMEGAVGGAILVGSASLLRPLLLRAVQAQSPRPQLAGGLASTPAQRPPIDGNAPTVDEAPSPWWGHLLAPALIICVAAIACWVARMLVHRHLPTDASLPSTAIKYFVLFVLLPAFFLPRRALGYWLAAVFAAAIWIAPSAFGGSFSWLDIGFEYGTVKHEQMAMGVRAFSNLAAMLSEQYRWDLHDLVGSIHFSFPAVGGWHWLAAWLPASAQEGSFDVEFKSAAVLLYAGCLVLCATAAAIHSRRNDPRVLAAVLAPWIIFPIVLCQMSERYLIWGSAASAALIVISSGSMLLHAILAIFASGMISCQLMRDDSGRLPQIFNFFTRQCPHAGWMMIILATMVMLIGLVPSRRGPRKVTSPSPG